MAVMRRDPASITHRPGVWDIERDSLASASEDMDTGPFNIHCRQLRAGP